MRALAPLLVAACLASGCTAEQLEGDAASNHDAIVGGGLAEEVPAIGYVAMGGINAGNVFFVDPFCTGTLIAPNVVLTAAHCAYGAEKYRGDVYFGIGKVEDKRAIRATAPIVLHPLYDAVDEHRDWSRDIAYMILDEPVTDVVPAKIARSRHRGHCEYVSTGYGVHREGYVYGAPAAPQDSGQRRAAAACADAGYTEGPALLPLDLDTPAGGMIRAYSNGTGSVCVGDSGGPLRVRGTREIVGVLSHIVDRVCTAKNRALYAPLEKSQDFIEQALEAGRTAQGSAKR